jgi:hypothetical protein
MPLGGKINNKPGGACAMAPPPNNSKMKMPDYTSNAAAFIKFHGITDMAEITGVVLYYSLLEWGQTMHQYHDEAKRYCYQLTDGTIGTRPKCTTDRIVEQVLNINKQNK